MHRLLFVIMFGFVFSAYAQTDSVYFGSKDPAPQKKRKRLRDEPWASKVTYGGNFQAFYGNPSFVLLSPSVGYKPTDKLEVGLGGIYNYTSLTFGSYGKFSQSIYGGHSYLRYIIAENYFLQTQFDLLKQPDWYSPDADDKVWVKYLLAGGGFRQALGPRAALMSSVMFNLTPHPFSIYGSRIFIQFGFITTL